MLDGQNQPQGSGEHPGPPETSRVVVGSLSRAEVKPAANLLAGSFQHDPFMVALQPDSDRRRGMLPPLFRGGIIRARSQGGVYVATDRAHLVGVMITYPPGGYPAPLVQRLRAVGALASVGSADPGSLGRISSVASVVNQHHYLDPHWYLQLIGVANEHQGMGIGSLLVRDLIRRATPSRLPIFVETSESRNMPFYERLGFRVIDQFAPGPEYPPQWNLLRTPA